MALILAENQIADVADIFGDGSLLLGGEPLTPAEWDALFNKWNVKHIVRCIAMDPDESAKLTPEHRGPGFRLLHLKLHDIPGMDICKYFESSARFIHEGITGGPAPPTTIVVGGRQLRDESKEGAGKQGTSPSPPPTLQEGKGTTELVKGPVFIHCQAGVSRSATIVISYLVQYHKMEVKHALEEVIRPVRSIVRPNAGFAQQLGELEGKILNRISPSLDAGQYAIDAAQVRMGSKVPRSVMAELYYSPECGQNADKLNALINRHYEDTESCKAIRDLVQGKKPKQEAHNTTAAPIGTSGGSGGSSSRSEDAVVDPELEIIRSILKAHKGDFNKARDTYKEKLQQTSE